MRYEVTTQSGSVYEIDTERKTFKRQQADPDKNRYVKYDYTQDTPYTELSTFTHGESLVFLKPNGRFFVSTPVIEVKELA